MKISLLFVFLSLSVMANSSLEVLQSKDYELIDAGIGCSLRNSKSKDIIYDNMSVAIIRFDSKAVKLKRKSGNWDDGFYNCGNTYEYTSEDQKINVTVTMGKGKTCTGKITTKNAAKTMTASSLNSHCGD